MQEQIQKWSELSNKAFATAKKFAAINHDLVVHLTQQQIELLGIYTEAGSQQLKSFGAAKDVESIVVAQSGLIESFSSRLFHNYRVTVELMLDVKGQFVDLTEKTFKEAIETYPVTIKN
ncbi:Phasin protein [Beggiatoa alba B18LD]|uniref:Phasin protein n=1 Tax=Beggiatoa alba B18LD TaxID=395493 RepID=I3CDD0_9GAMM|nr:phasin family protein [Beggiatoa alba]EIJ41623.1 Phasin protein [Beggiatoa alba B18LD]